MILRNRLEGIAKVINVDCLHGNCGNFAVALGNILGIHVYGVVYENGGFGNEGEPAHVALKIGGYKYIDADGLLTKRELRDWGFNEAFPEDSNSIEVVDVGGYADLGDPKYSFREIYDEKITHSIEAALRTHPRELQTFLRKAGLMR